MLIRSSEEPCADLIHQQSRTPFSQMFVSKTAYNSNQDAVLSSNILEAVASKWLTSYSDRSNQILCLSYADQVFLTSFAGYPLDGW